MKNKYEGNKMDATIGLLNLNKIMDD